jgi:hypothetical protein
MRKLKLRTAQGLAQVGRGGPSICMHLGARKSRRKGREALLPGRSREGDIHAQSTWACVESSMDAFTGWAKPTHSVFQE